MTGKAATPERETGRSFAHQHLGQADTAALAEILRRLYADAYLAGDHAAMVLLGRLDLPLLSVQLLAEVDWSRWTPGSPVVAEILRSGGTPGLEALLAQAEVTIKSVRDGYLNRLGDTLAAGAARGASVDELADDIRGLLAVDRAEMIANTETARAMTQASMDTYRANSVAGKAVITAEDQRVCEFCAANEAAGPIPLDQDFPFPEPPTHPLCRCAVVPYLASEMGLTGEPVVAGEEDLRGGEG